MKKHPQFTVGDVVTYSRKFCQSAGIYTREAGANRRGTVVGHYESKALPCPFPSVQWTDADEPHLVNPANLVLVSRLHLEPA